MIVVIPRVAETGEKLNFAHPRTSVQIKSGIDKPKRIFDLSPDQALEYQRHTFAAQKVNRNWEWNRHGMCYLKWRKEVSYYGIQ